MRKAAKRIVEKLRLHGHEAFFAGGCVRDQVMRKKPKDIDIATSAAPEQVLKLFPGSTAVGAQFGVVLARVYGRSYEVATFRTEGPYLDGRHPSTVSFTGPKQDAQRRDFTVNGLFYDPVADRIIDYVHGKADIKQKILRTIGKPRDRFVEDKLRMLRAVRFACSLDFQIEQETMLAIKELSGEILQVSWERIRDELLKILTGPDPARGLDLLAESGLLAHVLPEVAAMRGVEQPPEYHPEGDVFIHTRIMLGMQRNPTAVFSLAVLLHDVGKPPTFSVKERIRFDGHVEVGARMAEDICRRLRISTEETEQVVDLVRHHLHFINVKQMRESTLKRFLRKPNFADHLELHRIDCLSSNGNLDSHRFCKAKLEELKDEPLSPPPLITGHDLIEAGYKPGPLFKEILDAVEDLQLERTLLTRDDALQYVSKTFPLAEESKPQ
jgi:poly(A) polymerase